MSLRRELASDTDAPAAKLAHVLTVGFEARTQATHLAPFLRGAPVAVVRASPLQAAQNAVLSNPDLLGKILAATSKGSEKPFSNVCGLVLRYCQSNKCSEELFQNVASAMQIPITKPETVNKTVAKAMVVHIPIPYRIQKPWTR